MVPHHRAERALLERHGQRDFRRAAVRSTSSSSVRQRRQARRAGHAGGAGCATPDASTWSTCPRAALDMARSRTLAPLDADRSIVAHQASYESGLVEAIGATRASGRTLMLFLGSNIGNFDPPGADAFLRGVRGVARARRCAAARHRPVKPERDLLLAYDDPLGVTAAFNRNLLRAHQPRARRRLRPRRVSASRGLERRGVARRDAPGSDRAASTSAFPARRSTSSSTRARRSGRRARTNTEPEQVIRLLERARFRLLDQWIDEAKGSR